MFSIHSSVHGAGPPSGFRAVVPAFGVGADGGCKGTQFLLESVPQGLVHGLAHLVSYVTGAELAHRPTLDDAPR
ncbi:hypothetical protein [Streptomyces lavenduligriseus]|uniref:Uncharacterized protein n=1 Tax=Streptomyces lavenduligriseus TaxID=67315 RepID=A0ABT0P3E0_9ACTN|nr:hypothetical protein [Streptomyces lavenduligriseus]MCL3998125.1 hypothetical protein [Streptomyces lavenduligriseus]